MKKATLDISSELMVDLFAGEGFARTYTVKQSALPDDAKITFCRWVDETGTGGRIRLLIESEAFEDVPDGTQPPQLTPVLGTITDAIRDAYERAALACDELAAERTQQLDAEPRYTPAQQHYFADMRAAYQRAARAIRALKGEQ